MTKTQQTQPVNELILNENDYLNTDLKVINPPPGRKPINFWGKTEFKKRSSSSQVNNPFNNRNLNDSAHSDKIQELQQDSKEPTQINNPDQLESKFNKEELEKNTGSPYITAIRSVTPDANTLHQKVHIEKSMKNLMKDDDRMSVIEKSKESIANMANLKTTFFNTSVRTDEPGEDQNLLISKKEIGIMSMGGPKKVDIHNRSRDHPLKLDGPQNQSNDINIHSPMTPKRDSFSVLNKEIIRKNQAMFFERQDQAIQNKKNRLPIDRNFSKTKVNENLMATAIQKVGKLSSMCKQFDSKLSNSVSIQIDHFLHNKLSLKEEKKIERTIRKRSRDRCKSEVTLPMDRRPIKSTFTSTDFNISNRLVHKITKQLQDRGVSVPLESKDDKFEYSLNPTFIQND